MGGGHKKKRKKSNGELGDDTGYQSGDYGGDRNDEFEGTRHKLMEQLNERIQFNIYGRLWLDDKIPDSNLTEAQYNFFMDAVMKKTNKTVSNGLDLFHSAVGAKKGDSPPDEFKCLHCSLLVHDPKQC